MRVQVVAKVVSLEYALTVRPRTSAVTSGLPPWNWAVPMPLTARRAVPEYVSDMSVISVTFISHIWYASRTPVAPAASQVKRTSYWLGVATSILYTSHASARFSFVQSRVVTVVKVVVPVALRSTLYLTKLSVVPPLLLTMNMPLWAAIWRSSPAMLVPLVV